MVLKHSVWQIDSPALISPALPFPGEAKAIYYHRDLQNVTFCGSSWLGCSYSHRISDWFGLGRTFKLSPTMERTPSTVPNGSKPWPWTLPESCTVMLQPSLEERELKGRQGRDKPSHERLCTQFPPSPLLAVCPGEQLQPGYLSLTPTSASPFHGNLPSCLVPPSPARLGHLSFPSLSTSSCSPTSPKFNLISV